MTNLHKIRARIRSVNSTQQITRTMKMIAVSKLRKTQTSLAGVRLFADKGQEVLNALLADDVTFEHPYLTPRRRVGHVCYVVFWGNRGLCGAYNQVLLRHLEQLVHAETRPCSVIVCGRWGRDVLAGTNLPVREICAGLSDTPTMAEALEIAETLMRRRESDTSTKADIHERNDGYLHKCREVAQQAADYFGWTRVSCVRDGKLRSIEDIHEELYARVKSCLEEV